jgi:uncharacterized protein
MYFKGAGVPRDYAEAIRWYRKAAEQGDATAQISLGFIYHYGRGVPQDHAEAVRWYLKAAEQGEADAQIKLGVMHSQGEGVLQDYVQAYKWLNRASANGQKRPLVLGQKARAMLRDDVAAKMTPLQIAEGQRLSRE